MTPVPVTGVPSMAGVPVTDLLFSYWILFSGENEGKMMISSQGPAIPSGEDVKRLRDPGSCTQVAAGVDAVQCEDSFIVEAFFPNTDPAQLVTDYSYLFFRRLHNDDAYLAGDTIKRCVKITGFPALLPGMSGHSGAIPIFRLNFPAGGVCCLPAP